MTRVASFEINHTRLLNPDGSPAGELPSFAQDKEAVVTLYRSMVLTRTFDAKAVALQRTGRMGTFASSLGQEAVTTGIAAAMTPNDVLAPSFREQGALLWRGVTIEENLLYWGGDNRGSAYKNVREDFPISVPVGSHAPHAVGVAMAMKLRGEKRAAVCVFGDGATSKGDVYEAMNLAGVWKVPVIFVVTNNQWAISVPREGQTAAKTFAQKALAAGFDGEQVDGNDVFAMRHVMGEALARARSDYRPHLIEAITYRLTDHTTADDATRYRKDEEVSRHWKEDPIARLRAYLMTRFDWNKEDEEAIIESCTEQVAAGIDAYLASKPLPVEAMFDHLFAELPLPIQRQRDRAIALEKSED